MLKRLYVQGVQTEQISKTLFHQLLLFILLN